MKLPDNHIVHQSAASYPSVSVLVPFRNELNYLEECLESILDNDYPGESEIILIDGGSTDGSREIAERYVQNKHSVSILENPSQNIPSALNIGIDAARGDIIVRMDAHCNFDRDYIRKCVQLLIDTSAANVGGIWKPVGKTYFGRAIAAAMRSWYSMGNSGHYLANTLREAESVSMGTWWASTLRDAKGFNAKFLANQDYELNYRLRKSGEKLIVSPDIRFTYYAPGSLTTLLRKYFRRGVWKVNCLSLHPGSLKIRQVVPPVFIGVVAMCVVLAPANPAPLVAVLATYSLVTALVSIWLALSENAKLIPVIFLAFVCMHFAWGAGFLKQLLLIPFRNTDYS